MHSIYMGNPHNILVDELELFLFNTMGYDRFSKFMAYDCKGHAGEVDLLAIMYGFGKLPNSYDFYEVKSNLNVKSLKRAKEQFSRYMLAFPGQDVRGFLYSSDRIIRRLKI